MSLQTINKEDVFVQIKKPKMYKVILLNDDYTTMDFVIEVLISVFNKDHIEAQKIMIDVHKKGKGLVGVYTYDIATTKICMAEDMARGRGFPLKAGLEEE